MKPTVFVAAVVLLGACASAPEKSVDAPSVETETTAMSAADETRQAEKDGDLYCERYKPIGSNRTHRRCYPREEHDARVRASQEAEQRRRGG